MRIRGAKVLLGHSFVDAQLDIEDERISAISSEGSADPDRIGFESSADPASVNFERITEEESETPDLIDARDCFLIPALIDLHFHGCCGADLCDASDEALHTIAAYEASRGVAAICPATMTYPEDRLCQVLSTAADFSPQGNEAALVGINMEGPFISPESIGAQNPAYVQAASADLFFRLQEAAQGLIKLVDIAPEEEGGLDFIGQVAGQVCVSLAHTRANYDCAHEAFACGARHMTHLYNAMPALHHRNPGPIAAAWEHKDVTVELICDGIHIHPAMIALTFELFGSQRVVLISDSMRAAGLGDGSYDLGGQQVQVQGARATLANGALAGSVSDLMSCLRFVVLQAGIPLEDAVRAASETPARVLGLSDERGSIEVGKLADLVLLDKDLQVKQVILRGKPIL